MIASPTMDGITAVEKKNIDLFISQKDEEENLFQKIDVKGKKARKLFFLIGNNRIFFFKQGGKIEMDYHFLDIMEVKTDNPKEISIKFKTDNGKEPLVFGVETPSHSSEIILAMDYLFSYNFPGMKTNRMRIVVIPETRMSEIYSSPNAITPEIGPCGGLTLTYFSFCDHMGVQPINEVTWHIENVLSNTTIKDFDYSFFFKKDRLITGDARPLLAALAINTWFNSFTIKGVKLSNECITSIINLFQQSTTIEKITLNGIGLDKSGCEKLIEALIQNKAIPLKELDLGDNAIEDKGMVAIAELIKQSHFQISYLNLGGCGVGRAAMSSLGEALAQSDTMATHLKHLDINGNKLEPEGSTALSNFLIKSKALRTLVIGTTQPQFHQLKKCATLTVFDNSGNRIIKKDSLHLDMVRFLNHSSYLSNLNLSKCQMPPEVINELFGEGNLGKLEVLNVSENDLGDEGVATLCDALSSHPNLKSINISGNFIRRSKTRNATIESIINFIEKKSKGSNCLRTLILQGGSKSALKGDLLPIICSLYYNATLKELDISGHSIGDIGAAALGKLVQTNSTLEKLEWDDNNTSARGLQLFRLGMTRNSTLTHMSAPLKDIVANSLKSDSTPANISRMSELVAEIQQTLLDNLIAKSSPSNSLPSTTSTSNNNLLGVGNRASMIATKPRSSSIPNVTIDAKSTTNTCAGLGSFNLTNTDSGTDDISNATAQLTVK